MTALSEFYLGRGVETDLFDCFTISHPDMTREYRFCVQKAVTVEADVDYEFLPATATFNTTTDDLDVEMTLQLGDLGEIMAAEVDAILDADSMEKPTLVYRAYRSDDLTTPLIDPITLEVPRVTYDLAGSNIEARSRRLSLNRTGEIYDMRRFPMQRGFLT